MLPSLTPLVAFATYLLVLLLMHVLAQLRLLLPDTAVAACRNLQGH